jgi:hypothetical protein
LQLLLLYRFVSFVKEFYTNKNVFHLLDAAYKMLLGHSPDQKANFRDKQARLTRPDLAGESDVHAKLAEEHHSKKPREAVNPSTNTKAH